MSAEWILSTIDKMFTLTPIFCFIWCLACLGMLGVFKFRHPDKTFPEIVAMCYGGVAALIIWMIFVVRI